ncbi:MAG TPA: hypothetical protein VJ142_00225 [Candidatus Nanoarchaeia archaeon]|nr:hypothetical protein [Candidatus Nanoarchaeia archaeon]
MGRRIEFTREGIELLERLVVEGFVENPITIKKAAKILGLNLNQILQKSLKRYTEIDEDLLRIRMGMGPIYHPIEYYTGKSR